MIQVSLFDFQLVQGFGTVIGFVNLIHLCIFLKKTDRLSAAGPEILVSV